MNSYGDRLRDFLIVFGASLVGVACGTTGSLNFVSQQMIADMGISPSIYFAISSCALIGIYLVVPAGYAMDRWGPLVVAVAGALVQLACLVGVSYAPANSIFGTFLLFLLWTIIGFSAGATFLASLGTSIQLSKTGGGAPVAAASAGMSLSVISLVLAVKIYNQLTECDYAACWRQNVRLWAVFVLAAQAPGLALMSLFSPLNYEHLRQQREELEAEKAEIKEAQTVRASSFVAGASVIVSPRPSRSVVVAPPPPRARAAPSRPPPSLSLDPPLIDITINNVEEDKDEMTTTKTKTKTTTTTTTTTAESSGGLLLPAAAVGLPPLALPTTSPTTPTTRTIRAVSDANIITEIEELSFSDDDEEEEARGGGGGGDDDDDDDDDDELALLLATTKSKAKLTFHFRHLLTDFFFWALFLTYMTAIGSCMLVLTGAEQLFVAYTQHREGLDKWNGRLLMIWSVINALFNVGAALVVDVAQRRRLLRRPEAVAVATAAVYGVDFALLAALTATTDRHQPSLVFAFLLVAVGASFGIYLVLFPVIVAQKYGSLNFGKTFGALQVAAMLGALLYPNLGSQLVTVYGSTKGYATILGLCSASLLTSAATLAAASRRLSVQRRRRRRALLRHATRSRRRRPIATVSH